MTRLRPLRPRDVECILPGHGFVFDHQTGSHRVYKNPDTGRIVVAPFHPKDLPIFLISRIARQAGLPRVAFTP
jgi:predicted RNA binding protein YcfA (HicA-like mRNA interferase family)